MKRERTIDLDNEQYAIIKRVIESRMPYNEIWAYGSRVNWNASERADLDLVVLGSDSSALSDFQDALAESDLLISVDVMDWENISDDFKENIKKKYVVVQKSTMPKGWREVKLQTVSQINPLEKIEKGQFIKKINMHQIAPFTKKIHGYLLDAYKGGMKFRNGDTLIARITPCLENGKTSYVDILDKDEVGMGSTEFIVLREMEKTTDKHYLYYLSTSPKFRDHAIKSMTGTSGRQRVETAEVKNYKFALPPLPEQKSIAEVLCSFDDKIDLLRRQNKTLESMAQAFFRKWFIDNPNRVNWKEIKLADVYDFIKGFEPGSKYYEGIKSGDSVRFIRVGDMLNNREGIYISKDYAEKICEKTDLLISFDGTVGRMVFGVEGAYSSGIRKIVSNKESYNNLGFKYLLFNSTSIQNMIQQHAKGTVILHASSAIDFLSFQLPDEKELAKFNNMIIPIFDKTSHNQNQIRTLEKARDLLLPKLMSGKARIKESIGK